MSAPMNEPIYIQHSSGHWYWYEQDKVGSLRGPFGTEKMAKDAYTKEKVEREHQLMGRNDKLAEATDRVVAFLVVLARIKSGDMSATDIAVGELWAAAGELAEASYMVRDNNRRLAIEREKVMRP